MDMQIKKLRHLPEFKVLAHSLHQGTAAVMVGAGFSRSAAVSADPSQIMPLWKDFARLLNDGMETEESLLRLAEGFKALHKRQRLNQLLHETINDPSWQPSELYKKLLELPWSEVLTTNWDTLLERASMEITTQIYEVVNHPSDLVQAKKPRLVKLHGTIGVTENLIFTEEDYRTYPRKNAAFVNFARQVCIENDLCLLGFSGSDPNFLAWIGWIRDNLKEHSRNIYLVGVLNLTSVTRRYYESLNITPIDLTNFIRHNDVDERHKLGLELVLAELKALKPVDAVDWRPNQKLWFDVDEDVAKLLQSVDDYLLKFETERKRYPGWLLCPQEIKQDLFSQVYAISKIEFWAMGLEAGVTAKIFYELIWRYKLLARPIPKLWYQPLITLINSNDLHGLSYGQAVEISESILESLQWREQTDEIKKTASEVLELLDLHKGQWPAAEDVFWYWKSWQAYRELDFNVLEENLSNWSAQEPMWQLRKAGLLAALGMSKSARLLIKSAYQQFKQQYRNHPDSIYLFSRLAWAHFLWFQTQRAERNGEERWPSNIYTAKKADPWDAIQGINKTIQEAKERVESSKGIVPRFRPGSFHDRSNVIRFGSSYHPLIALTHLVHKTGVPLHLMSKQSITAMSIEGLNTKELFWWTALSVHKETDEAIETNFSRINLAKEPEEVTTEWLSRFKDCAVYWLKKFEDTKIEHNFLLLRLNILIQLIARLSIRAMPHEAIDLFKWATDLFHNPAFERIQQYSSLKNLIENSLEAIPPEKKHKVLLHSLRFSLISGSKNLMERGYWPKVVINMPGVRDEAPPEISEVINNLIDKIKITETLTHRASETENKKYLKIRSSEYYEFTPALEGLFALHRADFLSKDEKQKLKQALWDNVNKKNGLPATGLLCWTLLKLPHDNNEYLVPLIKDYLYENIASHLSDFDHLVELICSVRSAQIVMPTESQAQSMLDAILEHSFYQDDSGGITHYFYREFKKLIGQILGEVIIPSLPADKLNACTYNEIKSFIQTHPDSADAITGLAYLAAKDILAEDFNQLLNNYFYSVNSEKVLLASKAIFIYRKESAKNSPEAERLVDEVINKVVYRGSPNISELLGILIKLQRKNLLTKQQIKKIEQVLLGLFNQSEYKNFESNTYQSIDAPLVRRNCFLLAKLLKGHVTEKQQLCELIRLGKKDPLPEVKYVETERK